MNIRPIDANALIEKLDNINPVDYGAMSSYETHNGARDALSDAVMHVNDAPTLSINTLRDEVYKDAFEHGLYNGIYDVPQLEQAAPGLMLRIGDEVREAWSASLDWEQGKINAKEHVAEELADVIITALSVSGHLGIDIDAAMRRKIAYNKTRPYMHILKE